MIFTCHKIIAWAFPLKLLTFCENNFALVILA